MKRPSCFRTLSFAVISSLLWVVSQPLSAADYPQWRGDSRDGISKDKGLLKEWPKEGPKLLWQNTEMGAGYSSPSVSGGHIYVLGNSDLENEYVQALTLNDGKRVWLTRIGKVGNPDQQPKFPSARSTPTVDGAELYALGSDGDLACLSAKDGKIRWQKNLRTEFGGKPGIWAYSESPLVDGDALVVTPGGSDATILALNKKDGAVLWKCAIPEGDPAAYSSPIVVTAAGKKQYVQALEKGVAGLDAKTGKLLWRYLKTVSKFKANIPTPVAEGAYVYSAGAGTGGGLVELKAAGDGVEANEAYFSPKLPSAIGGAVKVGDLLYGTSQAMLCVDFKKGEVKWEDRAIGAASICYADERLYLHGENGEVALVEPSSEGYREKGRFTPSELPKRSSNMEKAWAYPVVADGKLLIRDLNNLWCYDIKR